jgi:hypothetical protein
MTELKFRILILSVVISCFDSLAQDIITSDGQSMGPKSIFMDVCVENMSSSMPDVGAPYSVYDFCNCMAEELLPTYTKSQINYYFTQNNMDEMVKDSISFQIISGCVLKNINAENPPPEIQTTFLNRDSLIMEVVKASRYELIYDYCKDSIVMIFAEKYSWEKKKIIEIRNSLIYEPEQQFMYNSVYPNETADQLREIKEYFLAMSDEEMIQFKLTYQENVTYNFIGPITRKCEQAID